MHIKRKVLFLAGFFVIAILNLILISHSYSKHIQAVYNERIFADIENHSTTAGKQFLTSAPLVLGASVGSNIQVGDARSANLKYFFRKYNSPLYDVAEHMVAAADKYGFDYRLLAAIAMQESGLCKFIPENSYNCWGFGIYGDLVTRFDSYDEGIDIVSKSIKEHYIDQGLVTPELIMSKYTPSSNGSWARGVLWTLTELR